MRYFICFILGMMWGKCMCGCGGEATYVPPQEEEQQVVEEIDNNTEEPKEEEQNPVVTHLGDCTLPKFTICAVCYSPDDCWQFTYWKCELVGIQRKDEGIPPIPLFYNYDGYGHSYCQ